MDISKIINFIKSRNESQIKFKLHSVDRMFQRGLDKQTIVHYLQNEELVGIHKQNDNVYKVWYTYNSRDDLSVVINITNEEIKIITTFLENSSKRIKNNGK